MSYDIVKEEVPGFIRRYGDRVIEGSNNVTMICGADRAAPGEAPLDSGHGHINAPGEGKSAGSWHLIAGRSSVNPNFDTDMSYIYVSMKTDVDKNLQIEDLPSREAGTNANETPAAIIKSDSIRFVARKDFRIVVGDSHIIVKDGKIILEGPQIYLSNKAIEKVAEAVIRGKTFTQDFKGHIHLTPTGPSSNPVPSSIPNIISNAHLSTFVKVDGK